MDIREFVLQEHIRGDCCKLLAACFYLPTKELFFHGNLFKDLTVSLKRVCPDAAVFSKGMEEAISQYTDEVLSIEYARLFVGPYKLLAPPYGSVYLDKGRRVMGDSTVEVIDMYQQSGLAMSDDFKEVPDHIAAELEFMYYLIFKEVAALEKFQYGMALDFIERQAIFSNRFLSQWVPPFCAKIKEGTDNKFYSALSDTLLTFVAQSFSETDMPIFLKAEGNRAGLDK